MVRRKSKNELVEVIDKYFKPSAGQIPVLIVDTGALIDFEEQARGIKSLEAPHKIAGRLFKNIGNLADNVVFPRGIYSEIMDHYCSSKKNGKKEIGDEIFRLVESYKEKSEFLLENVGFDYHYSESYRLEADRLNEFVKLIHGEVNDGRKGGKKLYGKDPISENDLELLNVAIKLSIKSLFEFRLHQQESGDVPSAMKGTYRIAVLSPDSHVYKPINTFITSSEGISYRDYLQAFNPREYQ